MPLLWTDHDYTSLPHRYSQESVAPDLANSQDGTRRRDDLVFSAVQWPLRTLFHTALDVPRLRTGQKTPALGLSTNERWKLIQ